MEISRYPQPKMKPGWLNSSPYVRRALAVFYSLPGVRQSRRSIPHDIGVVASWEAQRLPLEGVIFAMAQCVLEKMESQKARGGLGITRLASIGSPRYFEPAIERYKQIGGDETNFLTWAQLAERARGALALLWGWQDPGVTWPAERDPRTGRTETEERRYQKKILARAVKWGCSLAEAEARMIERARARARAPRQKRLPRMLVKNRARARANRKTMARFLL